MPEVPNELLSTFVDQAKEALTSMVGLDLALDGLSRPHSPQEQREIYSAVNLEGDLAGCVMIALDRPLAIAIVSEMLMAEPEEIQEDLLDGVGEILNVIVGGAKTVIQRGKSDIVLLPPETAEGEHPKSMDNEANTGIVMHCTVSEHPLAVWIWLPGIDDGVPGQDECDETVAEQNVDDEPDTGESVLPAPCMTEADAAPTPSPADEATEPEARLIVLGRKAQRSVQMLHFEPLPHKFEYVEHWHDVLHGAIRETPLAVLVEDNLIVGDPELGFLFQLSTTWPVLRFKIGPDGRGELISGSGRKRGELSTSLAEVAAGDASWLPANGIRTELRVALVARARYRTAESEHWYNANTLDIGARGVFVVSYEPPAPNTEVEVEVMDLDDGEIAIRGKVLWTRNWQDGAQLPGAGIRLEPSRLGTAALDKVGITAFLEQIKDVAGAE